MALDEWIPVGRATAWQTKGFEIKSLSIRYQIGRRYMMWSNIIFSIPIDILLE